MRRHKIGARDAIAIEKYEIVTAALQYGAIAAQRRPEAAVLVPDVV